MDDIGGPEVAQAEQELGQENVEGDYIASGGEAVQLLGDMPPDNNAAQDYADHCTS